MCVAGDFTSFAAYSKSLRLQIVFVRFAAIAGVAPFKVLCDLQKL